MTSTIERELVPASPESETAAPSSEPRAPRDASIAATAGVVAGVASVAAGALHVGAAVAHVENAQLSYLFLGLGVAQVAAGAALLAAPSRRTAWLAALVNLAAVAGWLVTRLVGIGWIEGLEQPEAPQAADTVIALLALVAVVAVGLSARRWSTHADVRAAGAVTGVVVIAVLAVGVVGAYGATTIGTHDHGGEVQEEQVAKPWRIGATDEEVRDTRGLVRRTQAALAAIPTIEAAEALGFVRQNDQHMIRVDRVFDDRQLDPDAPEALYVAQRDGREYIGGAMYIMDVNLPEGGVTPTGEPFDLVDVVGSLRSDTMRDVPRFGGPLMVWHSHGGFCFQANGVIDAGPEAQGTCPAGSAWLNDPPMLHVFTEPQVDDGVTRTNAACGTFTYMDLPHDQAVPGCGGAPVAHHDGAGGDHHAAH